MPAGRGSGRWRAVVPSGNPPPVMPDCNRIGIRHGLDSAARWPNMEISISAGARVAAPFLFRYVRGQAPPRRPQLASTADHR